MNKKCKHCKGKGLIQIADNVKGLKTCPYCNGTGIINNQIKKNVNPT